VGFSWLVKRLQNEISSPDRIAAVVFLISRRPFTYVPFALRSSRNISHSVASPIPGDMLPSGVPCFGYCTVAAGGQCMVVSAVSAR